MLVPLHPYSHKSNTIDNPFELAPPEKNKPIMGISMCSIEQLKK